MQVQGKPQSFCKVLRKVVQNNVKSTMAKEVKQILTPWCVLANRVIKGA